MASRPQPGVGDIVLTGARIFTSDWREFIKIPLITVLPVTIFGILFVATFSPGAVMELLSSQVPQDEIEQRLRTVTAGEWTNVGLAYVVFIVATSIANAWALGACVVLALDRRAGRDKTHKQALRSALSRLGSLLWLTAIAAVLISIGLLFCLLPGIWLAVSWVVAPVALLSEELKATRALGRSFRLVRPRFWSVLLVVLLEIAFFFILQTAAGALPPLFLPAAAEANAFAMFFSLNVAWALIGLVAVCVHAGIATELFFDLDERARVAAATAEPLPAPVPSRPPPPPTSPPPTSPPQP